MFAASLVTSLSKITSGCRAVCKRDTLNLKIDFHNFFHGVFFHGVFASLELFFFAFSLL